MKDISPCFKAEDQFFRVMNHRITVVITNSQWNNDSIDFGDANIQDDILELIEKFQALPLISDDEELSENWLKAFLDYKKSFNVKERGGFARTLSRFFRKEIPKLPLSLNVKFSRFFIFLHTVALLKTKID